VARSIGVRDLAYRWPTIYSVFFLQLNNHLARRMGVHDSIVRVRGLRRLCR
jgi:hypothetical protein